VIVTQRERKFFRPAFNARNGKTHFDLPALLDHEVVVIG
jgi:hypothetical protein